MCACLDIRTQTGAYEIGCCRGLYRRRMIGANILLPLLLDETVIKF